MAERVPHDAETEKAVFTLVGQVATTWSVFELILDMAIIKLAIVAPDAGTCITAQLFGIGSRFRALISLFRLRGGSDQSVTKLNQFVSRSEVLVRKRNRIVHTPVHLNDGEVRHARATADRRLEVSFDKLDIEHYEVVRKELVDHLGAWRRLAHEIAEDLPPRFRKSLAPLLEETPPPGTENPSSAR